MKQGLLFDLDGTLVDSLPGITASLNHALAGMGFATHGSLEVRRFIGNGSWVLAKRAAPQDSPDEAIAAIELAFKAHYDLHWQDGTEPFPGVPEVLAELRAKGHPMAVLSNKPHPFTTVIVERLFPGIRFDAVVGQKEGIPHKPDPAGALEIVRTFGLPPEDCILVGDSTIDLETARNAGIQSIAVTWGYHDRAPLLEGVPGAVVDEVSGLPDAIHG
ncbi:HAD-IA family hydrolase [Luteolibacter sp. SL250]|uniref:HAD family hydrolase n=1 Tax=Luteolibacter sp. SL250 TaxID=2995170 RepID=UPI00226EB7FB|nr:HAD-IA family hydrolase [Luteolibacter sp. SL250]WAC20768.1 HAD-IA family hydrolase [Luteolibacter sp. SL250]